MYNKFIQPPLYCIYFKFYMSISMVLLIFIYMLCSVCFIDKYNCYFIVYSQNLYQEDKYMYIIIHIPNIISPQ